MFSTPLIIRAIIPQALSSCYTLFSKRGPKVDILLPLPSTEQSGAFLHSTADSRALWAGEWECALRAPSKARAAIVLVLREATKLPSHHTIWVITREHKLSLPAHMALSPDRTIWHEIYAGNFLSHHVLGSAAAPLPPWPDGWQPWSWREAAGPAVTQHARHGRAGGT